MALGMMGQTRRRTLPNIFNQSGGVIQNLPHKIQIPGMPGYGTPTPTIQTLPHKIPLPGMPGWGQQPQFTARLLASNTGGNPLSGNVGPAVAPPPGSWSDAEGAMYRRRQAQRRPTVTNVAPNVDLIDNGPLPKGTGPLGSYQVGDYGMPQPVPLAPPMATHNVDLSGGRDRAQENYNVYRAMSQQTHNYMPTEWQGYTPREQGFMSSVTQANQSDPAGPYSRGMYGLGGPRNPLGSQPTPAPYAPQTLPTGTTMSGGSTVIHRPDGREVLLPPGMERDVGGAIQAQRNAAQVGMSGPDPDAVGMDAYRAEAAQRAANGDTNMQRAINAGDKGIAYRGYNLSPESMARYRAGRENRPLAGYATPMSPDQRAAIQAEAPNRRRAYFGLPPVPFANQGQGPFETAPPRPGAEDTVTRTQQVNDWFSQNPNATRDDAIAAGFTDDEINMAAAQTGGPTLGSIARGMDPTMFDVITAGIGPAIRGLGRIGVGPFSETATLQQQQQQDRRRRMQGQPQPPAPQPGPQYGLPNIPPEVQQWGPELLFPGFGGAFSRMIPRRR